MAPAVVWLAQHFRFARRRPAARHRRPHSRPRSCSRSRTSPAMQGVHGGWPATRAATTAGGPQVQRSALHLLRLGDDDLLGRSSASVTRCSTTASRASARCAPRNSRPSWSAAQLTTLQQQLHPHFLFNTLHAISSLMHRDVNAADRVLMQLSDLLRITLEHLGQQEVPLGAELDCAGEVPRHRADAIRRPPGGALRHPAGHARHARAEPAAAAAGRERDQVRRGAQVGARAHRHLRAPRRRQAAARGPRRRDRVDRGCADGAAQGHRRVDDPRPPAASLRRRLSASSSTA